jgi:predicted nucleic acid-binding protein
MPERRYWDAGCFIAWLQEEEGRYEECGSVLHAAEEGRLEIVTSAFTITEVLYPKGGNLLDRSLRTTVRDFLRQRFLVLVQVDRRVAEAAQDLVWDKGIRPKDALHVASALRASVYALETYDEQLIKKSGRVGGQPVLEIRHPRPFVAEEWELGLEDRIDLE